MPRGSTDGVATHQYAGQTFIGRAEDCNGHPSQGRECPRCYNEISDCTDTQCAVCAAYLANEDHAAADLANYGTLL